MANLKEIRNRIASVKSTMQITSAMKMVSAAKLKKAQDAITAMRPYANKLTELLQGLSATLDGDTGSKFASQREEKKILIVAITSNRGLCGAFNSNIIKEVRRAYCTAVYFFETRLVRKVIFAVPTTPAARLSAPTIKPNNERSFSYKATTEKDKFVSMTRQAPVIKDIFTPNLLTSKPPRKNPKIDAITATTLTTYPISLSE